MSLRLRIALAFAILVLVSATCTILIGNAIFGRKARELAQARLELDLAVVSKALGAHEASLLTLAASLAIVLSRDGGEPDRRLCEAAAAGPTVEWVAVVDARRRQAVVIGSERCAPAVLDGVAATTWLGSPLGRFATSAGSAGEPRSGTVVLDGARLVSAAARPLPDGRVLVLGGPLGDQLPELARTLGAGTGPQEQPHHASLYLGDRLVATTLRPAPPAGTRASPVVEEAVLRDGRPFVTPAPFAAGVLDSAYLPIRDFRGSTVGMVGLGTRRDVYGEIWRRTALLFTTTIAGGMGFGFLMAWFFSVTLTRPLAELAGGMARVADGKLDLEVRVDSADELGRLSEAFNVMVRGVKERDRRLREATSEKLSQVEKQVSVGRLAAGVAHEINNPMTAILSLSVMLRRNLPADDPRRADLDIVVAETQRCRDIVRHLLDFAQERPPEKQVVDVNEVMRETLALTGRYDALQDAHVEVRLCDQPLRVDADPKQIQQVFTNLVQNAAEALPVGGTITISSGFDAAGGSVRVEVRDNGRGIPRECLARVFEPFFTTKGRGKGTGLGLSVSLGIVQKHGGTIDIESEPDRGTTVSVSLPLAGEPRRVPGGR
ncbi:MAG TPA: ATP-binding protein [Vicinamibacteria bacterium]|nr:ATP-binding protein [Vicinamibacteria bacterium]